MNGLFKMKISKKFSHFNLIHELGLGSRIQSTTCESERITLTIWVREPVDGVNSSDHFVYQHNFQIGLIISVDNQVNEIASAAVVMRLRGTLSPIA